jgi:acetoin utilization protein AcuB
VKVRQYMSHPVRTVTAQLDHRRAFDLLHAHGIHHLPVVEGKRVMGMVAHRDLLLAAANFGPATVPVGEIMKAPPVCISEGADIKDAARLLVLNHIGSLPVIDDEGALIGIITETDIFKIMAGMIGALPEDREQAEDASLVC